MNTARRGIDQSSEKLSPRRLDNRGPGTDRRRSFRRSNPCRRFRMLIVGYFTASASSASCARRSNFTSPIVGSVASLSTTRCPITRRSLVFRTAPDSCRKRAAPALTFSANRRHSARGSGREEPARRRRSRTDAAAFTIMAHEAFSDRSSIFAILSQPRSNVKVPALPAGSCILTMRDRTKSSACSTT